MVFDDIFHIRLIKPSLKLRVFEFAMKYYYNGI